MNSLAPVAPSRWHQLENLPIGLFGSAIGLAGLSLAWRLAHLHFGASARIADIIGTVAVADFVAVSLGYIVKLVTVPAAVRAEFNHPVTSSLFGTLIISLLLLPLVLAPVSLLLAQSMWVIGCIAMNGFAWLVINRWMSDRQQVAHASPTWIIPVVGLVDVPLAVPALHFPPAIAAVAHELMVLDLSVGLFFFIPLFTLIFFRLLFEERMAESLQPTLLILVVPFAVGHSSYLATFTSVALTDLFAQALYTLTLFMLAVLLGRLRHLGACCPFRFSWWSVSFPLAASSVAASQFAMTNPGSMADAIALLLLALATMVIAGLMLRTLAGLFRGELRTLSG